MSYLTSEGFSERQPRSQRPWSTGPVLKWAGGKGKLVPKIIAALPPRCRCYYEPFLGGGSVFFALAHQKRFTNAVLGDENPELVHFYRALRDNVEGLCRALEPYSEAKMDATIYYQVRSLRPDQLGPLDRAARFLYLNKTCFNGLYRENRRGEFNVPIGRFKKAPVILDHIRLRAASKALQGVQLVKGDFEHTVESAQRGDVVYFDPPYIPLSRTSSFTGYTRRGFSLNDHGRLKDMFSRLVAKGVHAVLTNSATKGTRELYSDFKVSTVKAQRSINSVPSGRAKIPELLISSY